MDDWRTALDHFLRTDPVDAGCTETFRLLHIYAEQILTHDEAERRHPGIAAHLASCDSCAQDFEGLLRSVRHGVKR